MAKSPTPTPSAAKTAAAQGTQAANTASASTEPLAAAAEKAGGSDDAADAGIKGDEQALQEEQDGLRDPIGGGTQQKEPTAEQLPSEARVTPVAEQLNTAASTCVGEGKLPEGADDDLLDAEKQVADAKTTATEDLTKD